MEILEKIQSELKAFEEKKTKLLEQLRTEFPALLKPLFDQCNYIDNISWAQYTPYFNDGDECTFRRHSDISVNGEDKYEIEGWESSYGRRQSGRGATLLETTIDDFERVLDGIPESFYKDLFGDHVEVTISRNGDISVNEYEHD